MSIDPYTLVHRWFDEVWNQGREETVDELFASDGIGHGLGEGSADVRSPAGFKVFLRIMRSALPDLHIRTGTPLSMAAKPSFELFSKEHTSARAWDCVQLDAGSLSPGS